MVWDGDGDGLGMGWDGDGDGDERKGGCGMLGARWNIVVRQL